MRGEEGPPLPGTEVPEARVPGPGRPPSSRAGRGRASLPFVARRRRRVVVLSPRRVGRSCVVVLPLSCCSVVPDRLPESPGGAAAWIAAVGFLPSCGVLRSPRRAGRYAAFGWLSPPDFRPVVPLWRAGKSLTCGTYAFFVRPIMSLALTADNPNRIDFYNPRRYYGRAGGCACVERQVFLRRVPHGGVSEI